MKKLLYLLIFLNLCSCSCGSKNFQSSTSYYLKFSSEHKCISLKPPEGETEKFKNNYSLIKCEEIAESVTNGSRIITKRYEPTECGPGDYSILYANCTVVERENNVFKIKCENERQIYKNTKVFFKLKE